MRTVTLHVTPEDILYGATMNASGCPLGRAAERAGLRVGSKRPMIAGAQLSYWFWGKWRHAPLPPAACAWYKQFDLARVAGFQEPGPRSFTINLEF